MKLFFCTLTEVQSVLAVSPDVQYDWPFYEFSFLYENLSSWRDIEPSLGTNIDKTEEWKTL